MLALPTVRILRGSAGTSTDAPTSGEYRSVNSAPSCQEQQQLWPWCNKEQLKLPRPLYMYNTYRHMLRTDNVCA